MSRTDSPFPVVGIGASAGGVEALEGFFRAMPADTGMAFVVVTHLSPERESLLDQLVSRWTAMTVVIAQDGLELAPDTVFVMPSNAILGVEGGRLSIRRPNAVSRERKPVDIFFSALAVDRGEYAAGVILSGGDGDGTLGVKMIKERGGVTLAQTADGTAPKHPEMPDNAIQHGLIDFAVPVERMAEALIHYARGFHLLDGLAEGEDAEANPASELEKARDEICSILLDHVGHDFSGYKPKTFGRRVFRRMAVCELDTVEGYLQRLRQDAGEVNALFRDLLINVTSFFRDAGAFDILAQTVIPKLFEGRGANDTVRVWVPGCATGEEVYSIAILMREHMTGLRIAPRVQIFATDIDDHALSVARTARYPAATLEGVSPERRERFFIQDGGAYTVGKELRGLCVFSPHSVIRDPPFSRIDLVSCRNLLIYFGAEIQKDVIPTFHYSLRPGGFLFLGLSENASQFADLFSPIDKKNRVFRAKESGDSAIRVPMRLADPRTSRPGSATKGPRPFPASAPMRNAVEAHVLDKVAPPHVVVNAEGDIVYYSPRTGKYLEAAPGVPTRQLLQLAVRGLRLELRAALRESADTGEKVVRPNLEVELEDGRVQLVAISVEPLEQNRGEGRLQIVVFSDAGHAMTREQAAGRSGSRTGDTVVHLERELRDTRERLQTVVEEYETALEEIKSSNEELVSVNEEVQSSNEELEASKEELQSLNEELHTVNAELTGKVDLLDRANADLHNLFESTQVATAFLGRDLSIRNFTPAVARLFNIIASDVGRPLTDLTSRIAYPRMYDDIQAVFSNGAPIENRIAHNDGEHHFLVRITPYRDLDKVIDGVLVTFIDITMLKETEAHQEVLIAELNHRVRNMLAVVIGVSRQTLRVAATTAAAEQALTGRLEAMGRSYSMLSRRNWTETPLADLVVAELQPYGLERADIEGPPTELGPKVGVSLGMILHELATNALKYGALSTDEGRVSVGWTEAVDARGRKMVDLIWREQGGPPVGPVGRGGFGAKLIRAEAKQSLDGSVDLDYAADGLRAALTFPTA